MDDNNPYALLREQAIRTQVYNAVLGRANEWRVDAAFTETLLAQLNTIAQWIIDGNTDKEQRDNGS